MVPLCSGYMETVLCMVKTLVLPESVKCIINNIICCLIVGLRKLGGNMFGVEVHGCYGIVGIILCSVDRTFIIMKMLSCTSVLRDIRNFQ